MKASALTPLPAKHLRSATDIVEHFEWRQTFDAIELALVLVDGRGAIRRLNRAASDLLRLPSQHVLGRTLRDVARTEPWLASGPLVDHVLANGTPLEVAAREPDGDRCWMLAANPIESETVGAVLAVRDVTNATLLEASLRRMATVGTMLIGIAHEVRNPLFGISATLDAFEAGLDSAEDPARYFEVLRTELRRLNTLTADLLDLGRPTLLALAPCDLVDAVDAAIESAAPLTVRKRCHVHHDRPRTRSVVNADGDRLRQALINLVENALEHSPEGATVTIRHHRERDATGTDWATITIDDEGPGISDADLGRVFEPFFSRRATGTGLGLSIVNRIVEEHGGQIEAGRAPTGGARMTIQLVERTTSRVG